MAFDFTKFDKSFNLDELKNDVVEASNNTEGVYKEVPHGSYEVEINKMELTVSKKGDPMFTCWMKIIEGEYNGSMIFMNQVITRGFQIHIVNQFLRSLESGIDVDFTSYSEYAETILDIAEAIDGKFEYLVKYGENRGFNTFSIEKVYDVD